jgi:hypothetical protein
MNPRYQRLGGLGVDETAQRLGIWRKTAGHWRRRWRDAAASEGVAARLSHAPRCGAPAMFTPEMTCQIVALACEDPETLDVPIKSLASNRTGPSIGGPRHPWHRQKHLARLCRAFFKKQADLKPHLNRYWLTPRVAC